LFVRVRIVQFLAAITVGCLPLDAQQTARATPKEDQRSETAATETRPAFVFAGTDYFHRWSQNDQHEFTPEGQDNLDKWTDMITINVYQNAHDGDALAAKANAVLENYKSHKGRVLRTDSVPRTADRPAEHFIAVVFGRQNFIEAAFARFKLVNGVGCSIVYSHRIYGEKVGDPMSAWLKDNGPKMEKLLMDWNNFPSPASLRDLPRTESRSGDAKASPSKSQ
jgi:hypothetical protein